MTPSRVLSAVLIFSAAGLFTAPCAVYCADDDLFSAPPVSVGKTFTSTNIQNLEKLNKMHEVADQYMAVRDVEKAIRIYQDIVFIEPDDEIAYVDMGRAYMILGNLNKAAEAFANALDINPDNEIAQLGLKRISYPDLQLGQNSEVSEIDRLSTNKALQFALKKAGTYVGPIDGTRTMALEKAIIAFKKVRGFNPDTDIDEKTWRALEPYLELQEDNNTPGF